MYEGMLSHNRSAESHKEESAVWVAPEYSPASGLCSMWLQLVPLNKSLKVQSAAKSSAGL